MEGILDGNEKNGMGLEQLCAPFVGHGVDAGRSSLGDRRAVRSFDMDGSLGISAVCFYAGGGIFSHARFEKISSSFADYRCDLRDSVQPFVLGRLILSASSKVNFVANITHESL